MYYFKQLVQQIHHDFVFVIEIFYDFSQQVFQQYKAPLFQESIRPRLSELIIIGAWVLVGHIRCEERLEY